MTQFNPDHPLEIPDYAVEEGRSSQRAPSLLEALQQGVKRTGHPLDLESMLQSQAQFDQECHNLISHGTGISVDLSADFGDIKNVPSLNFNDFIEFPSARYAISQLIENRVAFAGQVCADIHRDLDDICKHFQINKDDIVNKN